MMKTLELFNGVIKKESESEDNLFISDNGFIIESGALWAKDRILTHYKNSMLDGNDLNKTFHKSWLKIKNSTRYELFLDQIEHYLSTYGSDFKNEVYIPDEVLDIENLNLKFKTVKAYSEDEIINKCLSMLQSGIALKEETINDILTILVDELGYSFTGNEGIRNNEAIIKIADIYGILPSDTIEFFRYIIYRTTGESLLIKNPNIIYTITQSNFNPSVQFEKFGLEKLAEIFNRFKPLFMAFKSKCPKTINKISKLSKKYHKGMISNPLNGITSNIFIETNNHWLDNATPFALFKALSACWSRMNGQDTFAYRIRNGKSFTEKNNPDLYVAEQNYNYILNYLKDRFDLSGKKVFLPEDVEYALPTSEKMYVGNIPTGTRFYGNALAVGIYWEDKWGADDFDISALNIGGKVGWNSDYKQNKSLYYSGDITSAHNGAVEYLYANRGLSEPTLVMNNLYYGKNNSGFKLIIGKGDNITKDYMMNPENLFVDIKTESVQKQSILGIFLPIGNDMQTFVVLNFGSGKNRVSGYSELSKLTTKALYQQWNNALSLKEVIGKLGVEFVDKAENADFNLSLDSIEKDSIMNLFV